MGSAREQKVSWNPDDTGRLGDRILAFTQARIAAHNAAAGSAGSVTVEVEVFDPAQIPEMQTVMKSPMYYLPADKVPEKIKDMCRTIEEADCFLIVTPEYNHTIPSALTVSLSVRPSVRLALALPPYPCVSLTPTIHTLNFFSPLEYDESLWM